MEAAAPAPHRHSTAQGDDMDHSKAHHRFVMHSAMAAPFVEYVVSRTCVLFVVTPCTGCFELRAS